MFNAAEKITLYHRIGRSGGAPIYKKSTVRAAVIEENTVKKEGVTTVGSVFIIEPPAEAAIGDIISWNDGRYHIESLRMCRDLAGALCGIRCTVLK